MGKYTSRFNDHSKGYALLWIANELAEANRLKRIELRIQLGKKIRPTSNIDQSINPEELEDKA